MKVLMKPIEMIVCFTHEGIPNPIKYKMATEEQFNIIKVDKILSREEEKLAGNRMILYKCQSVIDGVEKLYEIKYELNTCKWYLYKM